ncbi:hypothetical protein MHK_009443 [Candidatus Magnetomorum sp. HK-1]|nr:hypothetical protein MHK_009443 [Candidatus Magnetomorum sp. HK-1]
MASEETPHDRNKFVILCDFWDAYNTFELKQSTSVPEIDGVIRPQIFSALSNAVEHFEKIELSQLRSRSRRVFNDNQFIITLDGGVIFNKFDFSIEITRACTKISDARGPYIRMPRHLAPHLSQQLINLKTAFQNSLKNSVVLCDDGIGTAGTITRILNGLSDIGINVNFIVTVTNPNRIKNVCGCPIHTLYVSLEEYNWLNERDLYWGLPRSGLSTCGDGGNAFVGLGGIPYTINEQMVISRIGLSPSKAEQFRLICIGANMAFWKMLEKVHGRRLELRDCSRLHFFSKLYNKNDDVLNILTDSRRIDLLDKMG